MPQIFILLLIFLGVLVVHLSLIYFGRSVHSSGVGNAMKLIIDTDAGSDDAVALLLALALPKKLAILAITCTYGNTNETNVETNVLKVLTIAGRSDVPVYAGADKPLLQNYTAGNYFGDDGFGDFEFGRQIVATVDRSKHAAVAMIDLVKQHPGQVSILTLGPLTNVALATKLYKHFTKSVKRFYVMGSMIDEDESNPAVEFNFSLDPEANAIFLNSLTNVTSLLVPWDVALKNGISKKWRKQILGKLDSERIKFLNQAESAVLERLDVWYSADSITVATIIWPALITSSLVTRMSCATCGSHKGAVKLHYKDINNVQLVRDVDVEGFKEKLFKHLA